MKWKDDLEALTDSWSESQFVGSASVDHKDTGLPLYVVVVAGDTQEDMERRLHQLLSHGLIRCVDDECPARGSAEGGQE